VLLRPIVGMLAVCSLLGCGSGGFLPSGPHAIDGSTLASIVRLESGRNSVSPDLVNAMIRIESHQDPSAVSRAGAQGLMQLMPQTAAQYGVANAFDPRENVAGGTRYIRDLLARYHGNVRLALAAYNAGPASVDWAHGIPPFAETRAYVARVTASMHAGS